MFGGLAPREICYATNEMSRRKARIATDGRANAHSHCMHLLLSTSETVPVVNSRLALGTWQRVFLVELDGPRRREVNLRFISYLRRDAVSEKKLWPTTTPANGRIKHHAAKR